jgi:hypothetical protein
MPVFDAQLMFHSQATLSVSQSSSALIIRGTGVKGMAARFTAGVNTDTLTFPVYAAVMPRYWVSQDDVTYTLLASYPGGFHPYPPGSGLDLITPIVTTYKYIIEELVVTGTTVTQIIIKNIQSGMVTGVGFDWDRQVHFE